MSTMRRLAVLATAACVAHALTVKVEARAEDCFSEMVTQPDTPIKFIFQVTHGGQLDIDVAVYDPAGMKIHDLKTATDGRHDWLATAKGQYKVCFSNLMARWTPKWVSFYISKGTSRTAAKVEHLDPIEKSVIALSQGMADLQNEQKQLRAVESLHRETISNTNTRILYWSCFEAVVLLVMGLCQIYYLKRFLEVRSSI